MKIISYNVNGIRSALNKSFALWLKQANPTVLCLQEIKAQEDQIPVEVFQDLGYHCYFYPAQKKGYSGVAILSKIRPNQVICGMEHTLYDYEGRLIRADFGDLSIMSAYFPSGSSGQERQDVKMSFLKYFQPYIHQLKQTRKKIIIAGDYNIAHQAIDIHNPVANKNTSGFLPEERSWFKEFLSDGFVDAYRFLYPDQTSGYTWWTYRSKTAREKNIGWRIDYQLCTDNLKEKIKSCTLLTDSKHSDHCPVELVLESEID
jgi:exodeoxyribonuclease-3